MTNTQEDSPIMAQQSHITTTQTISQEMGMLLASPISTRVVRRRLQQRGLSAQLDTEMVHCRLFILVSVLRAVF